MYQLFYVYLAMNYRKLVCLWVILPILCQGETLLRHNYGVVLKPHHGVLHMRVTEHLMSSRMDLAVSPPPNLTEAGEERAPEHHSINGFSLHEIAQNLFQTNTMLYKTIMTTLDYANPDRDLDTTNKTNRQKRTVHPIGDFFHFCCGFATSRQLDGVNKNLEIVVKGLTYTLANDLERNELLGRLANRSNQVFAYLRVHRRELLDILETLDFQRASFVNESTAHINNFQNYTQEVFKTHTSFLNGIMQIINLIDYHMTANSFLLILQSLKQGRIPELLITDQILIKGIEELSRAVHTDAPEAHVIGSLNDWRKQGYWEWNNNTLFVKIGIYFSYTKLPYYLYRPVVFPIPVHSDDRKGVGYTLLSLNERPMIGIHEKSDRYILVSSGTLEDCQLVGKDMICPNDLMELSLRHPSCMLGLYRDDRAMIMNECTFLSYLTNPIPSFHLALGGDQHLLINQGKIGALQCIGEDKEYVSLPMMTVMNVPCGCTLSTDIMRIAPRLMHCKDHVNITIYIRTGINLPVAHAFNIKLVGYSGNSLNNMMVKYGIPRTYQMRATLSDIPEYIITQGIELIDMSRKINEKDKSILEKLRNIKFDFVKTHQSGLALLGLILAAVNTFCNIYLLYKMHGLGMTLGALFAYNRAAKLSKMEKGAVERGPQNPVGTPSEDMTDQLRAVLGQARDNPNQVMGWLIILVVLVMVVPKLWRFLRFAYGCCLCCGRCLDRSGCLECMETYKDETITWICLRANTRRGPITLQLMPLMYELNLIDLWEAPMPVIKYRKRLCGKSYLALTWPENLHLRVSEVPAVIILKSKLLLEGPQESRGRLLDGLGPNEVHFILRTPSSEHIEVPWSRPGTLARPHSRRGKTKAKRPRGAERGDPHLGVHNVRPGCSLSCIHEAAIDV